MNKKIVVCALSFFSITLFCAEENSEMETSRKRSLPKDCQVENQAKRQNSPYYWLDDQMIEKERQNDDMQISKNCSCEDLMKVRGCIAQVSEGFKQLEEELEGLRKEFNLLLFLTNEEVIKWLETNGQEERANELKGAVNFLQDRRVELTSELLMRFGLK